MTANEDQIEYWNVTVGEKWVANRASIDRLMAPLTEVLLQVCSARSGERVLDVGCGCGTLSLALAEAVGRQGKVVGVDLSAPMLASGQAARAQLCADAADIDFIQADAMTYDFQPSFDLVTSRFGVMFFEDRERAFANLCKAAVRPNGRFAFLAWRGRAQVEWMQKPLDWISDVVPMPEATDGTPGPFGLADGERIREQLADAGFRDVIAEPLDRELLVGESVDEAMEILLDAGPASRAIRDVQANVADEAKRLLREGLERQARDDGRVIMRGACWIYRGHL